MHALQHIYQPDGRVYVMQPASGKQGVNHSGSLGSFMASGK
jgi:hypothetical protein